MQKVKDILIIARPDHSIQIYNTLLNYGQLSFRYLGFKVFPAWMKKIMPGKKFVFLSKNYSISFYQTIINILKYKTGLKIFKNLSEMNSMSSSARTIFKRNKYKIVHYWPKYCFEAVREYEEHNPDVMTFADIHMPNPSVIIDDMLPVYKRYGISYSNLYLKAEAARQKIFLKSVRHAIAPSQYVVDTYKDEYPEIEFHIVPYGVKRWKSYQRRAHYDENKKDFKFVYAGRISLEKGVDIILETFSKMPQYELHLYGSMDSSQKEIFNSFRKYGNIFFHGVVPKVELQDRLSRYDIGIHMSRFDAYSLSVAEMIGVGLPVLISNKTGNMNVVTENGLGLVTSLNQKELLHHIEKITKPSMYNTYLDQIDCYLNSEGVEYEDLILNFYKKINYQSRIAR